MSKFLSALAFSVKLFPVVLGGVVTVETALAGASGETKKAAVLAAVSAAAKVAGAIDEEHIHTAAQLVDDIVAAFNKTGYFSKAKTAATVAAK